MTDEPGFGYTPEELCQLAHKAARSLRTKERFYLEAVDTALFAITECLYTATDRPDPYGLVSVGMTSIRLATRKALQFYGKDYAGEVHGRSNQYWQVGPSVFPEEAVCERLSLPTVLAQLRDDLRETLLVYAETGCTIRTAEILNLSRSAVSRRLQRAKAEFARYWFEHETPRLSGNGLDGKCRRGHSHSLYRRERPDGTFECVECRRQRQKLAVIRGDRRRDPLSFQ